NPNSSEIHQLIDWVKDRMREQYDIVRARVYVDSKRGMNTAIGRVENILATLDDKARKEYGKRAEAYIRAWVYTWDGVSDEQVFKEAASGEDNSYGKDPAGYLARSIRGLAQETLGYHAYHAHVPVYFGLGQNQNGVTSFKMNAVEMQFVYSFTRPMLDALERTYKSVVQTMRGAGFKPEYVQRILAIAQKGARKVLEEEVTGIVEKKSRSTGPYKGILMDFDGTMFETGPLYQKAMENVAKRFGVDPALFMEVFKFERSMGESCRNFVGKIMDKTIVGDTDGEIASELERKLFSPEIVARMNKVAFTPFDEKYLESQEVMAELLAQYIEREGQQLIRNDPQEARKTFVRPVPGFFDFLNKLPDDIIICPTSSARWTTIEEVFRLYGLLKDKRIKAKFSEEDAVTLSGNARLAHKPQLDYYLRARQVLNTVLKDGTYLPSGDLLILGDNAKAEWSPVFAEMEDGLTTVLVSDKDARLVTSTDDNVAKTNSYYELAKLSQDDLAANAAVRGDPLVIERMRQTLKRKKFGMADLLRGFMVSRN
ncbi:hypothetical protein HY029_05960, partial [Candidatus Gottesmanbacteria bacterium]|nr:hypothetical protein [Candidatus Gottesmanbacteria bacterium]